MLRRQSLDLATRSVLATQQPMRQRPMKILESRNEVIQRVVK
jgi:hypothetical protein